MKSTSIGTYLWVQVCTTGMYLWYVPTGMNIPGFIALIHEVPDVLKRSDCELRKVLNVGTEQGMLTDPQVPLVIGVQQVPDSLAVDLHVAHLKLCR